VWKALELIGRHAFEPHGLRLKPSHPQKPPEKIAQRVRSVSSQRQQL
jgi:hypothetical protein